MKNKIEKSEHEKNIVVCFLANEDRENISDTIKNNFFSLIEVIRPYIIYVNINEYSQNLDEVKKISRINIIKYFGRTDEN